MRAIGVDQLSYRRHHKYITIITDHESGKVVWAREGKSAATLDAFFADLGPERCQKLLAVTLDMSQAYIQSVQAHAPQAALVFERMNRTRLDECFRIQGRKTWYIEPAEIQRDLDVFLRFYNLERSHQGYRLKGRTPAQALREALNLTTLPPVVPEVDSTAPEAA